MQQTGFRLQRIAGAQDDSSGEAQRTVEPCAHDRSTIYLGVEFRDASLTYHFRIRLDTEGGRVAMGAYQMESRIGDSLPAYADGIERGVVLGEEQLVAWLNGAYGSSGIHLFETGSGKTLLECLHCEEIHWRCIEKCEKVFYHSTLFLSYTIKARRRMTDASFTPYYI